MAQKREAASNDRHKIRIVNNRYGVQTNGVLEMKLSKGILLTKPEYLNAPLCTILIKCICLRRSDALEKYLKIPLKNLGLTWFTL